MHLNVKLALWRYFIEASAAGVALYVYYAETVARILAYPFEAGEKARFDLQFKVFSLFLQPFFFSACLVHNLLKLAFFLFKRLAAVGYLLLGGLQVVITFLHLGVGFTYFLVAQFYFKRLELNFFAERVVFTVVLNVVKLGLVTFYACLGFVYLRFFLLDGILELLDVVLYFFNARGKSGNLVFEILHFKR